MFTEPARRYGTIWKDSKMNDDLERIADLCLNYTPNQRLDKIADQIRILELEVNILTRRLNELEDQEIERPY